MNRRDPSLEESVTGIAAYFENGGTLGHAQQIAAHESPPTTKLYDRTSNQITLDEIERIAIKAASLILDNSNSLAFSPRRHIEP